MTKYLRLLPLILALSLTPFPLSGCAGKTAREKVAIPAMVTASDGIQEDVEDGIATLPADQRAGAAADETNFFGAIGSKDRTIIATEAVPLWPSIKSLAGRGIQAQFTRHDIGPAGINAKTERLNNFEDVLKQIALGP